jgi:hypothetical protein
MSGAELGAST